MTPGTYAMNAITNSASPKPNGLDSSFNQGWDSFTDIAAQPFCEIFNDDRFRQFNRRRIVLLRHFSRDRSLIFLIPLVFMLALV